MFHFSYAVYIITTLQLGKKISSKHIHDELYQVIRQTSKVPYFNY